MQNQACNQRDYFVTEIKSSSSCYRKYLIYTSSENFCVPSGQNKKLTNYNHTYFYLLFFWLKTSWASLFIMPEFSSPVCLLRKIIKCPLHNSGKVRAFIMRRFQRPKPTIGNILRQIFSTEKSIRHCRALRIQRIRGNCSFWLTHEWYLFYFVFLTWNQAKPNLHWWLEE